MINDYKLNDAGGIIDRVWIYEKNIDQPQNIDKIVEDDYNNQILREEL